MHPLLEIKNLYLPSATNTVDLKVLHGQFLLCKVANEQTACLLASLIFGEQPAKKGEIYFEGQSISNISEEQLFKIRQQMAAVMQPPVLISNLKVWENITLPYLYHAGGISADQEQEIMHLLDEMGYHDSIWTLPGHLTSIQRLVVAFVRAIVTRPKLLIFADCLSDLEPAQQQTILKQLAALRGQTESPAVLLLSSTDFAVSMLQPDYVYEIEH